MEKFELIAPCHFGLEAVMKREILDLGYEITSVEDGKVTFEGDAEAIAYANVFLRTTERILLKIGQFRAETFEELFEKTKALPWERYIPKDGKFWVTKANSVKSKLIRLWTVEIIKRHFRYHLSVSGKTGGHRFSFQSFRIFFIHRLTHLGSCL